MAAYDVAASPAVEGQKDADSKKISFRFCRECSNMLYPKEDRAGRTLMFACRTCQFSEEAEAACIYRNSLKETIAETPGNVQDVAQDPTVGDDHASNSMFASNSAYDSAMETDEDEPPGAAYGEGVDVVPEFCTLCGQEILCPICEQPTDRGIMLETEDPEAEVQRKGEEVVELEKRERSLSGAGTRPLPHADVECKNCGTRDAVFFQSQQRTAETGMALFYVCCECQHVWSTLDEYKK